MTPVAFRKLALVFEGASENAHGGHPDFRVGGKVFASLGHAGAASAMVKLTPEQQKMVVDAEPAIFMPTNGVWGQRGYTKINLSMADARTMRSALAMAWKNVTASAPSRRAARSDGRAAPRSSRRAASRG